MDDRAKRASNIATQLSPGERVVLESALFLEAKSGQADFSALTLKEEITRRQGRAISDASFRQRLKRLNDSLNRLASPFVLVSSRGRIAFQETGHRDESRRTVELEDDLEKRFDADTMRPVGDTVAPLARPSEPPSSLLVFFSYAWLNQGKAGKQQHQVQIEFYQELAQQLAHPPPTYRGPSLRLWRDESDLERSEKGDPQIDAKCREAFLGLLLLSNRYPHRPICMREADFFLTSDGDNKPGKRCLIVPVNLDDIQEAPPRFSRDSRVWMFDGSGKNLLKAWQRASGTKRFDYAKRVAEEIFRAATRDFGDGGPTGGQKQKTSIEDFIDHAVFEHQFDDTVGPRVRRGRLGASVEETDATTDGPALEIVPHLADWASSDDGPRLTALLGDFGMGKTVTCQLLTQELLTRRKAQSSLSPPLPLYFDLRNIDLAKASDASLERFIDEMLRRVGEDPPSAREVIAYARQYGALVIFDGLDEVAHRLSPDQANRLYRELLSIAPVHLWKADGVRRRGTKAIGPQPESSGPRILVSCRTHFFPNVAAQRSFLTGTDRAGMSAGDDVQVFFLLRLSREQIEAYFRIHLSEDDATRAIEVIDSTYNLGELAQRPILLRFVREAIGQLENDRAKGRTINISRLYELLVDQTFARDDSKHVIPVREKKLLLKSLAQKFHRDGLNELSGASLADWLVEAADRLPRLKAVFNSTDGLRLSEIFLQDIRNATLLVRVGDTSFRFAHRSIQEYFLAASLYDAVVEGNRDVLEIPVPSPETLAFILARYDIDPERSRRDFRKQFPTLMVEGYSKSVRLLMFEIWLRSNGSLPRPHTIDLSGLNFGGRIFRGDDRRLFPLHATRWNNGDLHQVEFDRVDLQSADFSGAMARMTHWLRCHVARVEFDGADLQGSVWRHVQLDANQFSNAKIRDSIGCAVNGDGIIERRLTASNIKGLAPVTKTHNGGVWSVALGRAGERDIVVSGGDDGTVRIWDAVSGSELAALKGHNGGVVSVALGRAGERDIVISGGSDGTVRIWDAVSGSELAALKGHNGGVWSVALGRAGERDIVVSGGSDGTVRIWDAVSGSELAALKGHNRAVVSVALGRAGERDIVVSGGDDGTVRIWDAVSGSELAALKGHNGGVWSVALGRAGERDIVVSGGDDGTVRIWDAVSGSELAALKGHNGGVVSVALGRAGERDIVVSGGSDGTVRIWDAVSGSELAALKGHNGGVMSVALGRAGERDIVISGGSDGTVRIWDAVSGSELAALKGHNGGVWSVALGRAGERDIVVSGGSDGTVRIWDAVSGSELAALKGHNGGVMSVALGRAGERDIVVSGGSDGTVRIWDAVSGSELAALKGHNGGVWSVALGRAGERDIVVSGGSDGTVRIWDAVSGSELAALKGHNRAVVSVALGRAGERDIVVSGGSDGTVRIWDAVSGSELAALKGHNGGVWSVALGRAGERDIVVSGGSDGTVRIWDAVSGSELAALKGHNRAVVSVALGRAGERDIVVSGGDDGTVRIWDAVSGSELAALKGHNGGVMSVALDRAGERDIVVSGGSDGTVRIETMRRRSVRPEKILILGPAAETLLELTADDDDGFHLVRASDDAWRYWQAQGSANGLIVTIPIDDMPRSTIAD